MWVESVDDAIREKIRIRNLHLMRMVYSNGRKMDIKRNRIKGMENHPFRQSFFPSNAKIIIFIYRTKIVYRVSSSPIKIYLLGSIDSYYIPPNIFSLSRLSYRTNVQLSRNNENRKRENITVYFLPEWKIYFHLFPITKCSASIAKLPDMFTSNHWDAFLPSPSPFIALVLFIQRVRDHTRLLRLLFPMNWNDTNPRRGQSWNIIIRNNSHRRVTRLRGKGKREREKIQRRRTPFFQRHRTTAPE